jgi:cytochrome c
MFAVFAIAAGTAKADGDPAAGQKAFVQCVGCHSVAPGENKVGPSLAGIYGRAAGALPDYSYSPALKSSGLTWDEATLDKFLAAPTKVVPGTKMVTGVINPAIRANLIAYLKTLKGP